MRAVWRRWRKQRGVRAVDVETIAGDVAQVDFGYVGWLYDAATGRRRKEWVFVLVLVYSRRMFARIAFDQKIETWPLPSTSIASTLTTPFRSSDRRALAPQPGNHDEAPLKTGPALKKLRLSGVLQSLELRTRQAVDDDLANGEFPVPPPRLRRAAFESSRSIEDFDFHFNPKIPKNKIIDCSARQAPCCRADWAVRRSGVTQRRRVLCITAAYLWRSTSA